MRTTEGEYAGIGGRVQRGAPSESTVEVSVFTRRGVERVARYAFERARERRTILASATKSNALQYTAVLWDEVVSHVASDFPDVEVTMVRCEPCKQRLTKQVAAHVRARVAFR